ncbi:MAG: FAD-dependent oxidoreductase [Microbacterium sp.]|uniref:FAD-dependent monooxygenase n=1 Tax=Microbacterium sp. TaxID=51671 RepID=UPI0039E61DDD
MTTTDGDLPDASVIVVGAGPTGLCVALELALHGVSVILVEARAHVEPSRPRAKTISARTMELFRRWGVSELVRRTAPIPVGWSSRITFCETVTGPEVTHLDGAFGLDLAGTGLVAESGQQMPQPVLETVLRRHVAALPGVTLLEGWRAAEVEDLGDRVRVEAHRVDALGVTRTLTARWLVGADGARSIVRRSIGARLEGEAGGHPNVNITFRSDDLVALVARSPSIHYWVLGSDAPGVVGPLDLEGTWWAIATGAETIADEEEAASIVRRMVGAPIDCRVLAIDPWQAQMCLADHYARGRMLIAGDAAHQNPPWGGHGFNTGVGDAANLGWKLAAIINEWAPQAILGSYEQERRPVARATIDAAAANMETLSSDVAGRSSADIVAAKRPEFFSLGLVLDYGYPSNAGEMAAMESERRPPARGKRLPHQDLADGSSLFDQLGVGMTVLGSSAHAIALAEVLSSRGVPTVHRKCPAGGPTTTLVRPDQHVAWTGDAVEDPSRIVDTVLMHGSA